MYKASIRLSLGKRANDYFKVMDKNVPFKRSSAKISRKGGEININIEANDPVALISTINSFMKQIRVIGDVEKLVEE